MTETIEQKALALVNEVAKEMDLMKIKSLDTNLLGERALCRAIEQHEAFRREVSKAVEGCALTPAAEARLSRFIIPQPDPIAEAWIEATGNTVGMEPLNAALAARGLKIVEDK